MSCRKTLFVMLVLGLPVLPAVGQATPTFDVQSLRAVVRPADLAKHAKNASAPIAQLFHELSTPADQVTFKDGKTQRVRPIPQFLGAKPTFADTLEIEILTQNDVLKWTITSADLSGFVPYEQLAWDRIGDFLRVGAKELSESDRLAAAETALRAVLRFHEGTRLRLALGSSPWDELRAQIEQQQLNVRRQLFEHVAVRGIKTGAVDEALPLADFMLHSYPRDVPIRTQVRRLWAAEAAEALNKQDWRALRKQLARIDEEFVFAPESEPLALALKARAETLAKEATSSPDDVAVSKLQEAIRLWPRLAGVRDALANRQKTYSVLYVAVRSLPVYLSPATAWTDSEKHAVELLFESLVDPQSGPAGAVGYRTQLAKAAPALVHDRRRFDLIRDAYWADGSRVTPADVRHTVQLLRRGDLAGRSGLFTELLDIPRIDAQPFVVDFKTRQGLFDPWMPFSFKVLPEQYRGQVLSRADDEKFAKAPLGSGPFVYGGTESLGKRTYAVFRANPSFVRRSSPGRPFIREIRMFAWRNPKDLAGLPHLLHLVLDVATEHLNAVAARKNLTLHNEPAPRVYFLAINHRVGSLADRNLRKALAHALNREKLLTDHFRGGQTGLHGLEVTGAAAAIGTLNRRQGRTEFHWPLNGPYPVKSWAASSPPRVPANLYDLALAKSFARQALKSGGQLELTLKFPTADPRVQGACKEIKEEIESLGKSVQAALHIKLLGLSPREMKSAIDRRDFELAYHHYDHVGADFGIWPLFDQSPEAVRAGGTNYLGYDSDGKLQSLLHLALSHRSFPALQEATHNIHAHLYEQMPLIPLWQLHSHMAIDSALVHGLLDPLLAFSNAADWKLKQ